MRRRAHGGLARGGGKLLTTCPLFTPRSVSERAQARTVSGRCPALRCPCAHMHAAQSSHSAIRCSKHSAVGRSSRGARAHLGPERAQRT